jgi:cytochrome c oxidase subunit 2
VKRHVLIVTLVWLAMTFAGLIAAQVAFEPAVMSDKGQIIDDTFRTLLIMSVPVFTFVLSALGYSIVAFRRRGEPEEDGAPISGRGPIPLAWFVITSVMALGVMVYPGLTELPAVVHLDANPDLIVRVQGVQWAWALNYPQQGVKTSKEMVLPVNRKIGFEITSADVIHSVWIPAFRVRVDAVPGLTTYLSFTPTQTGTSSDDSGLRLQCSQLCGLDHAKMALPVRVVSDAEFADWVKANGGGAAPSGGVAGQPLSLEAATGAATAGFKQTTLDAKAGEAISLTFANGDTGIVHNVAVMNGADVAGSSDFKPGPDTQVINIPALPAGTYKFLCQAHPTTMTGTLTVK